MKRAVHALLLLVTASVAASCSLSKTEAPPISGPAELGLTLSIRANPDVLTQDGFSQTLITIEANDANGRPLPNVAMRAEIVVGSTVVDFGQLSARTLVTGTDGRALLTYTAPGPPAEAVDTGTVVTVRVVPTGTDFANAIARTTNIRLVPRGVILPPNGTPTASFTFSPNTPTSFSNVQFDASGSSDDGAIVSYNWQFGDGGTGTGVRPIHQYRASGDYQVTLTVTDDRGLSASTTRSVSISATGTPAADFSFSPARPGPLQTVFFNASTSTAATGRRLVSYAWNFGNGRTGSGVNASTSFPSAGSFNVNLLVTDDAGQTASVTKSIVVEEGAPGAVAASFNFSPTDPIAGVTRVFFNGSASSSAAGISTYQWDLGDGNTATGVTTDHVYQRGGTFSVRLTVRDNLGATATTTQTVTVKAADSPTADFSFSPTSPTPGQTVTFNASASTAPNGRTIQSYAWDLGNGQTRTGSVVTTSYSSPGTFTVTLTVRDDLGQSASTSKTVTVASSAAPTADFSFSPSQPTPNQTVTFNGSASAAASGRTITSYAWDFGNGQRGTGLTATTSYATTGTFNVTLTVTDDAGRSGTISKAVTVAGNPGGIVASFTFSPTDPTANLNTVSFNASASTAPAGISSYSWDFGDGATGTGVTTTHLYTRAGTFSVRLTVRDNAGNTATTAQNVTVRAPDAPAARFTFSPSTPGINQTVTFNASASTAASGRRIATYRWDYGDGSSEAVTQPTTTHVYSRAGTFTVALTVTDDIGQTNTASSTITVSAPVANFSFSPTNPVTGDTVFFNASSSTAAAGIAKYEWDFGDGCGPVSDGQQANCPAGTTNGVQTNHRFTSARTFAVRLTITDNAGNVSTITKDVTVTSP